MTIKTSGTLFMSEINAEFPGDYNDLNSYRGATWYTDTYGQSGTFGVSPIYMSEFYGKRGTSPPAPYVIQGTTSFAQNSAYYNFYGYSRAIRFWPAMGSISNDTLSNGGTLYSLITDLYYGWYIIASTTFSFSYLQIDGVGTWYSNAGDATGWFPVDGGAYWFFGWSPIPGYNYLGTYNFRIV